MNLIESAAAGIRGAENGTLRVYVRGTTTRATWYEDFEGTVSNATGDDIDLDGDGRAIVYVNQYVDVQAYDADGEQVCSFTVAAATPLVEYQGSAFTGTNYSTGATGQGSGYAVSLHTILGRALTSFGSYDWKVLVNGTPTILSTAIGGVLGLFFNVKDPTYGAEGDGVTNDATAIQAAIDAAAVDGGIVFFPPGVYKVGAALSVPGNVSMWGCGAEVSVLEATFTNGHLVEMDTNTANAPTMVRDLGFEVGATPVAYACLSLLDGGNVLVENCAFSATSTVAKCVNLDASTTSRLVLSSCYFATTTGSISPLVSSQGSGVVTMRDCVLVLPATYNSVMVECTEVYVNNCLFSMASCTAGTVSCIGFTTTTVRGAVNGCKFVNGGGATITAIVLGTYSASSFFSESANIFGTTVTAYSYTFAAASAGAKVALVTRETRHLEVSSDSSPLTVSVSQYGSITIRRSTNAAQQFNVDTVPPEGATGTLVVISSGAAPGDLQLGTGFEGVTTASTLAAAASLGSNDDPSLFYRCMLARSGNVRCKMIGVWAFTV